MSQISTGDTAFMLFSAALVAIMTPGLAFFYGGLVHRKNVIAIMMQSFVSLGVVTAIWVVCGFSLAFGQDHGGLIGSFEFVLLRGVGMAPNAEFGATIPFLAFFVFQLTVAALTPALITGAFADRLSFGGYVRFLALWSLVVYIPICHWVWGGGFLAQWGVADFGGGLPVHAAAGFAALASVFAVRKRALPEGEEPGPSNVPLIAIGLALLWFGWLGDNPGNALSADGVAAQAFVNTLMAGGLGMGMWLVIDVLRTRKASMVGALTGVLAGLVGVTPCAGLVPTWAACLIALIAGAVCYAAVQFRMARKWDDSLDVWGVHGIGGALGAILLGIFAFRSVDGIDGLAAGNPRQLALQCAGVGVVIAYSFVVTFIVFKVVDLRNTLHVPRHVELQGLDGELHGEEAYAVH